MGETSRKDELKKFIVQGCSVGKMRLALVITRLSVYVSLW